MRILRKLLKFLAFSFLLIFTWGITVYHRGVPVPPKFSRSSPAQVQWIPKSKLGINQIILEGDPFEIGLAFGQKTQGLIYAQEKELIGQLNTFFPNAMVRRVLEVLATRWFWGIDKYFSPWMLEEIYGVSLSTSTEFNYLGNPFTRQIAYHGLHEVGQLAVDQGSETMGCTVVAVPYKNSWVIGRNFDFEGGRIFDTEKIMKWVYPKDGYAYLSIIWAGMVGAVSGVNEQGVYISLNAAGSTDFARYGTPSTLVITEALKNSKSAREAVKIIQDAQMFITDLFVVSDRKTGELFRIEKSPKATEVIPLKNGSVVTNHLISSRWIGDSVNRFRTEEQTSRARSERGEQLIAQLKESSTNSKITEDSVLKILRDKGEKNGVQLHLGNRKAIDALIANHSLIYNEYDNVLYVSQGPGVSGPFSGFDLKRSFAEHKPITVRTLPRDPQVTPQLFSDIRQSLKQIALAEKMIQQKHCQEGKNILDNVKKLKLEFYSFYLALGDFYQCTGVPKDAKENWQKALDLSPAYKQQERYLKRVLND